MLTQNGDIQRQLGVLANENQNLEDLVNEANTKMEIVAADRMREGLNMGRIEVLRETKARREQQEDERRNDQKFRFPIKKPRQFKLGTDNFKSYLITFKTFCRAARIPRECEIDTLLTFLNENLGN